MQNGCTHVGELAQFPVSDGFNGKRVVNQTRIRHHEAGNIRPVFIQIGRCRTGDNGTGDIGTAARKGFDCSVGHTAVKSGNNGVFMVPQLLPQDLVGFFLVEGSVLFEKDNTFGINKGKTQIF